MFELQIMPHKQQNLQVIWLHPWLIKSNCYFTNSIWSTMLLGPLQKAGLSIALWTSLNIILSFSNKYLFQVQVLVNDSSPL